MADIKDALKEIVNELKNLRDLRYVPDEPTKTGIRYPFVVVYPETGEFKKLSAGFLTGLHNINIELHIMEKDLPRDYKQVIDLFQAIPKQLMSGQENARFSNGFTWETITYRFGPMIWAGVETIGVTYTMVNAKVQDTVS